MLMDKLKASTNDLHKRLENNPLTQPLMSPELTKAHYQVIVQRFYGFHAPMELRLEDILKGGFPNLQFDERRKVQFLVQDLKTLGMNPADIARLPLCIDLPSISDLASAVGVMYVLEGATLGGKIISKQLQKTISVDPDSGGAFFSSYREKTGAMWESFRDTVNHLDWEKKLETQTIESAKETFLTLEKWLSSGMKNQD